MPSKRNGYLWGLSMVTGVAISGIGQAAPLALDKPLPTQLYRLALPGESALTLARQDAGLQRLLAVGARQHRADAG